MYHQFNIQQFYVLPTQCIYVFCVDLRTNSDYFPIQHQLAGLYNRDGVCLLRGTDWIFKRSSGLFTNAPHSSLSTCCSNQKDRGRSLGTFQTTTPFPKIFRWNSNLNLVFKGLSALNCVGLKEAALLHFQFLISLRNYKSMVTWRRTGFSDWAIVRRIPTLANQNHNPAKHNTPQTHTKDNHF